MISERVRLAREYCGLTQSELADKAGITQSAFSRIESGTTIDPPRPRIEAIAAATGFPVGFFYRQKRLPDIPEGYHRRLVSLASRDERQVRAQTCYVVDIVQRMEQWRLPPVAVPPVCEIAHIDEVESIAYRARDWMQVGLIDPIRHLIRAVERAGAVVVRLPIEVAGHDGFSIWPDRGVGGRPVIVLTEGHPGDRDRFSVAHEFGHIVLDHLRRGLLMEQAEREANYFAGALLLPKEAAVEAMEPPVTIGVLKGVKATYGMSIQAAAQRAFSLSIINSLQLSSIHKQLRARKWHINEPVVVELEHPLLFPQVIEALGGGGTVSEQAERIEIPVFALNALIHAGT